jgi:hypothetical protein
MNAMKTVRVQKTVMVRELPKAWRERAASRRISG